MIGRKLCARLAADGAIAGRQIESAHLVDIFAPAPPAGNHMNMFCRGIGFGKSFERIGSGVPPSGR